MVTAWSTSVALACSEADGYLDKRQPPVVTQGGQPEGKH